METKTLSPGAWESALFERLAERLEEKPEKVGNYRRFRCMWVACVLDGSSAKIQVHVPRDERAAQVLVGAEGDLLPQFVEYYDTGTKDPHGLADEIVDVISPGLRATLHAAP